MTLSRYEQRTEEELRAVGSKKWTAYPNDIGAFVAEMDFGTAPVIETALTDAIHNQSFGYLPAALSARMSKACADWYARSFGWDVDPAWVYPGPDVLGVLQYTIDHLSDPDKPIIVLTPTSAPFLPIAAATGRQVIEVPLQNNDGLYQVDLVALSAAFETSHGGLLLLTNPQNPVGRVFTRVELLEISDVVEAYRGRVFADEIHAPIIYGGSAHVPYASISPRAASHSVTAVSASKGWNLAGLKCAQIILTNDADRAEWERTGYLTMHAASVLGVLANAVAYESGASWVNEVVSLLDTNRVALGGLIKAHLPEISFTPPEGTYLGWLDCRELATDAPAALFRKHANVALIEGSDCGLAGQGFVRFNFAMPSKILETAVFKMRAAVDRM
jgi:cystathionine beta-lyase